MQKIGLWSNKNHKPMAGYEKLILAEFDYDNKPIETFPFDQAKPRWSMWILKKYILPLLYWHKILKGTA